MQPAQVWRPILALGVAAVVVAAGIGFARGELPPGDSGPTPPAWLPTPDPNATSENPDFINIQRPLPPATQPATVTILGEQFPYSAETIFNEIRSRDAERDDPWIIQNNPDSEGRFSYLFVSDGGRITSRHVLAEDVAVFLPLIEAATPPLAASLTIAGDEIEIIEGMRYHQELTAPGDQNVWTIIYQSLPAREEDSYVTVREDGWLQASHIDPGDRTLFQPLIDVLYAAGLPTPLFDYPGQLPPPPELIPPVMTPTPSPLPAAFINGQHVPLAPGMTYGQLVLLSAPAQSPAGRIWEIRYDADPTAPGGSWMTHNEQGSILDFRIRPEDAQLFQPFFDAAYGQ